MRTNIFYNRITFSTFCALIALCTSSICWSTTYYVDATGGNDSNAGTATNAAWKTISKINTSSFSAGDSILFKKGETWREQLTVPSSGSAGNVITIGAYGTGEKPVITGANLITTWTESASTPNVWKATDTTEPNVVIFNGTRGTKVASATLCIGVGKWYWSDNVLYVYSTSTPGSNYTRPGIEAGTRDISVSENGKSYVTLQDLDVQGANTYGGLFVWTNNAKNSNITIQNNTIRNNHGHGINVGNAHATYKTTNILLDNNAVYENGSTGINVGDGVNVITISRNVVHHNNWARFDYNAGIRTNSIDGVDGQLIIIEYNKVYNQYFSGVKWAQGNGIHVDYVAGGSIVRYNEVYNNEQVGIFIEATPTANAYYNLVYGNGESGILIYRLMGGVKIYNNSVYGNLNGIALHGGDASDRGMHGHVVKNNISFGNTNQQLSAAFGAENDGVMGYNNVYLNNSFGPEKKNFIEWGYGVYKSTYTQWETIYGGMTSSVNADPLFVSTVTPDFHLQSSSPARDAGTDVGLTIDYAGNKVPMGTSVDIGAYEYQVGSIIIPKFPLSPTNIIIM